MSDGRTSRGQTGGGLLAVALIARAAAIALAAVIATPASLSAQQSSDQELEALQNSINQSRSQEKSDWNDQKGKLPTVTMQDVVNTAGGNNANAIVDEGNRQAAAMRAIGNRGRQTTVQPAATQTATTFRSPTIPRQNPPRPINVVFMHSMNWSQGRAHVVSSPSGIDCPYTCSATFAPGVNVAFTATADGNSIVRVVQCYAQTAGGTELRTPGNSEGCVWPGQFAAQGGSVVVDVDAAGSGQQQVITGSGLPPSSAGGNTVASTYSHGVVGGGSNLGGTGTVDQSNGTNGADTINGVVGEGAGGSPQNGSSGVAGGCPGGSHYQCTAPLPTSCISAFWDPKYYGWLSFQNNCGQTINLRWVSVNNTGVWGGSGGANIVAAGASTNIGQSPSEVNAAGGKYSLYICPVGYDAVDGNGNFVRGPGVNYFCRKTS